MQADSTQGAGRAVWLLELCFILSGATGLIYEILWSRYLALYIGSTGHAQVVVLCVFMGGLALGSRIFGSLADRRRNPLLGYALLELGIGIYAFGFDVIFVAGRETFLGLVRVSGLESDGWMTAKIVSSALTMLLPAFLMGGTFPMISRHLIRSIGGVGPRVSRLYFLNSLGAAAGCLAAGFWLIQSYGLPATMNMAGVMNVLIGLVTLAIVAQVSPKGIPVPKPEKVRTPEVSKNLFILVLTATSVSGAVSMMYEVAWIRMLALVLGSSTYAFSLMLTTFITGLAIGGWILSLRRKESGYGWIFAFSSVGVGVSILLTVPFYVRLPYVFNQLAATITREPSSFLIYQFFQWLLCIMVMIVPTVLQGITLPAATKLLTREIGGLGGRIGLVFAVNTLGTMGGAMFAGFCGLPLMGLKGTLELAVGLNMIVGVVVLLTARDHPWFRRAATSVLAVIACVWIWYASCMGPWDREAFSAGLYRVAARVPSYRDFQEDVKRRKTLFYRDGTDSTVAVQQTGSEYILVINGKPDASSVGDLPTQRLLGHLPMFLNKKPENVLVVGIGSGATIGSVLTHGPKRVDAVEISQDVIDASRLFSEVNGRYWEDSRVRVRCEDAKTFLQVTGGKYDVIISEPSNPWMAGVAGVFSEEFYQTCREHLNPGGIFVQWLHTYEIEDRTFFMIAETFRRNFPYWTLWNSVGRDVIFVGSTDPFSPQFETMSDRMDRKEVKTDLAQIGIETLSVLLSLHMTDFASETGSIALSDEIHSDFRPVLDYEAPVGFFLKSNATSITWLDERLESPMASRAWLAKYWKEHTPGREEIAGLYEYAASRRGLFPGQPLALAQEWMLRFPSDPAAELAFCRELGSDSSGVLSRLKKRASRPSPAEAGLRARLSYSDYNRLRNAFRIQGAESTVRDISEYLKSTPEAADPLAEAWCGQVLFDLGRDDQAVAHLMRAAVIFKKLGRQDEQILAGVFLCKALVRLKRFEDAAQVYQEFLAPYSSQLPSRLALGRLQDARAAAASQR